MREYLSLIKFSHTVFAMPFALIGFFLAAKSYEFEWITLFYVVFCMVFARSAAMAFNRYIDRDIDTANPRTAKVREIPNGSIKAKSALIFVLLNCLFFIGTTYLINPLCLALSPIALLVILGLGLALAPIGAYLAVSEKFEILPILFSLVVLFWVSGFDIIYSLQDEEFDKAQKLHSIPVLMGKKNALTISKFLHLISIIVLAFSGTMGEFGVWYWIGFSIFTTLLIYQHSLVKLNDLSKINLVFFTTNGIASVIFGAFVLIDILN